MRSFPSIPPISCRHALTLIELIVSVAIMAFLFTFCAYLTFMTALSMYSIHEQVIAQSSASSAMERTASILRNAVEIKPVTEDKTKIGELDRARFSQPVNNDVSNLQWGKLQFETADADGNGDLQIFLNEASQKPDFIFKYIHKFGITIQSENHVTLKIDYTYRGASRNAADSNHDGVPDSTMSGALESDIVAKNYSSYGGGNDDDTTTTDKT